MAMNGCAECLKKQRETERLTEENQRLKQKRRYQERQAQEGFFGALTPSAKLSMKSNTKLAKPAKRKGAQPGHPGAGRQAFDATQADRVEALAAEAGDRCPACVGPLEDQRYDDRLVVESRPVKAERILSRLPKQYGPRCQRTFQSRAPAVLPKGLDGNQRIATTTTMHSLHGIPLGRVCDQTGLGPGSLVEIFHRVARLFARIPERLAVEYR